MARPLVFELDEIMTRPFRRPAWKVFLYDTQSTADTIGSIVRGLPLQPLTGPLEITDHVAIVDGQEKAGDFATSGIPATRITLTIIDDTPEGTPSRWDPQFSASDTTAPARFLRRGNTLRLVAGDLDVDPDDWPIIFTGKLVGQPGVDRGRAVEVQGRSVVTCVAVGRESKWANLSRDSDKFDRLTTYLTMGDTTAREDMALDADEISFSSWGAQTTGLGMQFLDQSPLVSIAQLMFIDGFMPKFTGEGKLSQTFADIAQPPARIYLDDATWRHEEKPFLDADPVNSVTVIGIEGTKSEIVGERQALRNVEITTGYFTNDEELEVNWTDDGTQLAKNVKLDVLKSVNGGLSILGGGESFDLIPAPGAASLSVGATLELSTGYAPYIMVYLAIEYIALSLVPDSVGTFFTIPVGRIVQAVVLAAILIIMTKIGRGQYVFVGDPVEYVYQELSGIAEIDGTLTDDLVELEIENHLVQTQADADDSALLVLFRQQARGNPRNLIGLHDLRLEPHDVIERASGRRFLIDQIRWRMIRSGSEVLANYATYEVTPGVEV